MKPTILFLFLSVAAFCACKKETTTAVDGDYISFKVDGTLKTVKGCQGNYFKSIPNDLSRVVIIGRTDKDEQMILDVMGPIVGDPTRTVGYYAIPAGGIDTTRFNANILGTIKIKSLTTDRVTGTFQFAATSTTGSFIGTKNITEGSFGCKVLVL